MFKFGSVVECSDDMFGSLEWLLVTESPSWLAIGFVELLERKIIITFRNHLFTEV